MIDDLSERLDAHLRLDVPPAAVRETTRLGLSARVPTRRKPRFPALVVVAISGGLIAGSGVVAYAAPQTWSWLFPSAVTRTFTFPGGVPCTADITAVADYSSRKPTPVEMVRVSNAARSIPLDDRTVLKYLSDAERDTGQRAGSATHLAERRALMAAVQDLMLQQAGEPTTATWAVSTSCD